MRGNSDPKGLLCRTPAGRHPQTPKLNVGRINGSSGTRRPLRIETAHIATQKVHATIQQHAKNASSEPNRRKIEDRGDVRADQRKT